MKRLGLVLIYLFLALPLFALPVSGQTPDDVPSDHWAYKAVEDLASKGLIKGYPPSGKFFGGRTVTRYEMATIVQRVLARFEESLQGKANKSDIPDVSTLATKADLEAARTQVTRLVDEFRMELTVIRTDVQKALQMLETMKADVSAAKQAAEKAQSDTAALKAEVDAFRKEYDLLVNETLATQRAEFEALNKHYSAHRLSGYLQARFEAFEPGNANLFAVGAGGTGQSPTTGGPAVGGPKYGFLVRRARLAFGGQLTTRTDYRLQIDVPSTGAVAVKDAYLNIADLPLPQNSSLTAGLFPPPFGFELVHSSSTRESPERAAGFSDSTAPLVIFKTSVSGTGGTVTPGSVLPLFNGQDRDVGAMFNYSLPNYLNPNTRFQLGVFNGEGRGAAGVRNLNRGLDVVGRATTTLLDGHLDIGVSGYYGSLAVRSGAPVGGVPTSFRNGYRMLAGADVRWLSPWGSTFRAEYAGGVYEYTPDRARYFENNHAEAWLVSIKHPLSPRLDFAVKYDEYYPVSQKGRIVPGTTLGRSEYARRTIQGGFLYYLDEATRFRLWYSKSLVPYDPSAGATSPLRAKLGFITGEVQVVF